MRGACDGSHYCLDNDKKMSLSDSIIKTEKLRGDVTEKRHISDLDCSLGPVVLCMTLRFCKSFVDK